MNRFTAPSPAMIVACIALTVALSGVSYAAITIPRNSVGTPQLKKNAVISAKVKAGSLLASDFRVGQLPARPRWALVAGNGTIVRQSGGIAATGPGSLSPTTLHVDFGTPTAGKAFLVSVHPGGGATSATAAPCVPSGAQSDTVICDPDVSTGAGNDVEVTVDAIVTPTAPLFYIAMLR